MNSSKEQYEAQVRCAFTEMREPESLVPHPRNPNQHGARQIELLAKIIRHQGWRNPVVVSARSGFVIAGHGRLAAALLLGMQSVPVDVQEFASEADEWAHLVADNRIAELAEMGQDSLVGVLRDLGDVEGFDLDLTGFDTDALAALINEPVVGLTDPDDVPDPPAVPVSEVGDLWILGPHRLICGDSTDPAFVAALLVGEKPHLMVTDPPYGVEYDPEWRARANLNKSGRTGKVLNDDRADWSAAWALFPGDVAYVWHGAIHAGTVSSSLEMCGFDIRAQIIWAKERLVMGRGHYHWQHEPCWYAVRNQGHWAGDRKQTTLWHVESRGQDCETVHGTQKPVECMKRPMLNNSKPGDAIYEPFSGSGSTLIAAHATGRRFFGVELNPDYVDVAVDRWERYTGLKAERIGKGG